VWLGCFERVLEGADVKYAFPPQHLQGFKDFLVSFSGWMINKA
jgi:hemoglobin